MFTSRWYHQSSDLERIKALLVAGCAKFRFGGYRHVGDIDWALWYGNHDADRTTMIRLWEDDNSTLIGYAMLVHTYFEFEVAPHLRGSPLEETIVDWCETHITSTMGAASSESAVVTGTDGFASDSERIALLERRGYKPSSGFTMFARSLGDLIDEPPLPDGYIVGRVRGTQEADQRAEAHFHAF